MLEVEDWVSLPTFLQYPPEVRRVISTTNAVELLHRQLRKVTKNKSVFPHGESLRKMLFLAAENTMKKWTGVVQNWPFIYGHLVILFGDRAP